MGRLLVRWLEKYWGKDDGKIVRGHKVGLFLLGNPVVVIQ